MASTIKPDTALRYPLDQDFARIRMWQSSSSAPELQLALELHFWPEEITISTLTQAALARQILYQLRLHIVM